MATKSYKRKGLNNPAVLSVASSAAGQQATVKAIDLGFTVLKWVIIAGGIYWGYTKWKNRFAKRDEISSYGPSNISMEDATVRAQLIYSAKGWFTEDFDLIRDQFVGLNYNAVIRVYNAFGLQKGHLLNGDLNLFEWLHDQLSKDELAQLRILIGSSFF